MTKPRVCPTCGHKIGAADSPPCPRCGSRSVHAGRSKNKTQRYLCSNRKCRYIFSETTFVNTLALKKKKTDEPVVIIPAPLPSEPTPPTTGSELPADGQPPNVDESTSQP